MKTGLGGAHRTIIQTEVKETHGSRGGNAERFPTLRSTAWAWGGLDSVGIGRSWVETSLVLRAFRSGLSRTEPLLHQRYWKRHLGIERRQGRSRTSQGLSQRWTWKKVLFIHNIWWKSEEQTEFLSFSFAGQNLDLGRQKQSQLCPSLPLRTDLSPSLPHRSLMAPRYLSPPTRCRYSLTFKNHVSKLPIFSNPSNL